jgi:hypothetical protein
MEHPPRRSRALRTPARWLALDRDRRVGTPAAHTRGLLDGGAGAQLVVHGKGGKERVVPISDSLAGAIGAGAAGHTLAESSSGVVVSR